MSRIICVSNRVSLPDPKTGEIKAGGLAVGVKAALESNGGGIWIGWSGETLDGKDEDIGRSRIPTIKSHKDITFLTIPYSKQEYKAFYKGAANKTLWPVMHALDEHVSYDENDFSVYERMNKMYARLVKANIRKDDVIWVHDYHLMPLGKELRKLGVENRIGYFHHTPMPHKNFLDSKCAPELNSLIQSVMKDMFHYDLVGLQSFRDLENVKSVFNLDRKNAHRFDTFAIERYGRITQIGVFPISIETDQLIAQAKKYEGKNVKLCADRKKHKIIMGAERLDYTKGIEGRLHAYKNFLNRYSVFKGNVKLYQICPLTRSDIKEYGQTIERTRAAADDINQNHNCETWSPLEYSENFMPREELMAGFRCSHVGLVTPLIDGQNLVAKEFMAVQDPSDPGILILSKTAGAAEELEPLGVPCVDPNDPDEIADKLASALQMPRYMRMEIHRKVIAHLSHNDIAHWAEMFLQNLANNKEVEEAKHHLTTVPTTIGIKFNGDDYQTSA